MAKIRAYRLAEELGLERPVFVQKAEAAGVPLRNAMVLLDEKQARQLREKLSTAPDLPHPPHSSSRHHIEPTPVPEVCFTAEWRLKVVGTLEPYMLDRSKIDSAISETERALGTLLWAKGEGLDRKPERLAPSVRGELEELRDIAKKLRELHGSLSEDAQWFLIVTDPLGKRLSEDNPEGKAFIRDSPLLLDRPRPEDDLEKRKRLVRDSPFHLVDARSHFHIDGFEFLTRAETILEPWASRALEMLDDEAPLKISPGPPYGWHFRLAGEELADVWEKWTGRGLSRHGWRDDGPFPTFLRTVIQAIEPGFDGVKLARQIQEGRRHRREVDRLEADKRKKPT